MIALFCTCLVPKQESFLLLEIKNLSTSISLNLPPGTLLLRKRWGSSAHQGWFSSARLTRILESTVHLQLYIQGVWGGSVFFFFLLDYCWRCLYGGIKRCLTHVMRDDECSEFNCCHLKFVLNLWPASLKAWHLIAIKSPERRNHSLHKDHSDQLGAVQLFKHLVRMRGDIQQEY